MKTLAASVTGRAAGFNKRTEDKPKKKYAEVRQEKKTTRVHTHPNMGATVFNYSTTATVKVPHTHPLSALFRPHARTEAAKSVFLPPLDLCASIQCRTIYWVHQGTRLRCHSSALSVDWLVT